MSDQTAALESNQLTHDEAERLRELEEKVDKSGRTAHRAWVELGDALRAIRDERLYRVTHKAFQDYCLERWGFDRERARQLIGSSDVVHTLESAKLPTRVVNGSEESVAFVEPRAARVRTLLPETESRARPMMSVPPAERPKVWDKAVESASGRQPTSRQVRVAVQQIRAETSGGEEEEAQRLLRFLNAAVRDSAKQIEFSSKLIEDLSGIEGVVKGKVKLVGDGSEKLRTQLDLVLRYAEDLRKCVEGVKKLLPAKK